MDKNYDVVIVGGGIIGNSIAFHLAKENLKVALINSTSLGLPASLAAAGLFQLQISELVTSTPAIKDFYHKSFEYFLNFYDELKTLSLIKNIDLGFNQPGSLYMIFSNYELAERELKLQEAKPFLPGATFLNKSEVHKYEPLLTQDTIGAYYYPNEGYINNPKLINTISTVNLENHIEYINAEAVEINLKNKKIESIILSNGHMLKAEKYVLCNGVWANKLLRSVFNISENIIQSVKGEIVQLGLPGKMPIEKVILCHEGYVVPRPATNTYELPSILVGSTTDEVNLDDKDVFCNSAAGVSFLLNLLQKILPSCKNYPISKMWAGLRPKTRDNLPVIGTVPEITNLLLGLGHYRSGILMGPLTGKVIKELLTDGYTNTDIEFLNVKRFIEASKVNNQKQGLLTRH